MLTDIHPDRETDMHASGQISVHARSAGGRRGREEKTDEVFKACLDFVPSRLDVSTP